jgi:hypothetical protein
MLKCATELINCSVDLFVLNLRGYRIGEDTLATNLDDISGSYDAASSLRSLRVGLIVLVGRASDKRWATKRSHQNRAVTDTTGHRGGVVPIECEPASCSNQRSGFK